MHNSTQTGQAALIAVMFFLTVTLAIIFSFSSLAFSQVVVAREMLGSKRSFATSESGIEDVASRLQYGMLVDSSESISLNGGTTVTEITDIGLDTKEINSASNVKNSVRNVNLELQKIPGISFIYGAYVGFEGLKMEESAVIYGSVYSNSSIEGKGDEGDKSLIVGDVWVAGGVSDTPDQEMYPGASPVIPPPITLTVGDIDERKYGAQSFVPSVSMKPFKLSVLVKKIGDPHKISFEIMEDDGGIPKEGGQKGKVDLREEDASSGYQWIDLFFHDPKTLTAGNIYWIRIKADEEEPDKYWDFWGDADSSYSLGTYLSADDKKGPWFTPPGEGQGTPTPADMAFRLYLGDDSTYIDKIEIKSNEIGPPACMNGESHAYSITNSDLWVDAYYNSDITGSVLNCGNNSGQSSPDPIAPPISDAQIDAWKMEATAGGTHNGLLEIDGSGAYGPIKVDGDLKIKTNSTLNMTGNIYVTGKGTFQNDCIVQLDPSYGKASGIIVIDGQVDIHDQCEFRGSGDPRSYLIVITTNNSLDDPYAMRLHNESRGAVFYSSKGGIELKSKVEVKAIYAEKLVMKKDVTLRYEEGLANITFSTGPGGAYIIRNWQEIE